MDFDQTQAIDVYEEEEEEQVEKDKAYPEKKEAAQLKVFSQQGFKESIFPVFQGDNVIGRDGKCKITIPIKALSKKHACIEVQRDLHLIYDCESKNRTKKGKSFLKPTIRYELKHGDMLTLGDVKCQYLIDLDTEEDEGDETGSETGSESMLPDATTEEELETDKPVVHEDVPNTSAAKSSIPSDDLLRAAEDFKVTKPHKDEEEAYAADTDSDTDEERPLAVAAMATVLYSSEDEHETPARQRAAIVPSKRNTSMEGQTLAFGLGSPDNVFRNRDSCGSATSHPEQTASVPPTLMLSSESDIQSDGKTDLSSDNKQSSSSSKHPGAGVTGTQPTCEPTLVYGSESEDGSPMKRPRHPEARVTDLQNPPCDPTLLYGSESEDTSPIKKPRHPEARLLDKQDPPCDPTLLYGSESEDASPIKKPKHPRASNVPTVSDESDSEEGIKIKAPEDSELRKDSRQASNEQTLRYSEIPGSSPGEIAEAGTDDKQEEDAAKDAETTLPYAEAELSSTDDDIPGSSPGEIAEAGTGDKQEEDAAKDAETTLPYAAAETTLPYAAAEMSSTDDEEESDVEKPTSYNKPTKPNRIEESEKQESNDGEDNMATDEYGEDCATQPYTADSNFETDSETIPFVGGNAADKSDANQPVKPSDVEATQAYCVEEEEEEGDSDSSDSQPLPIGPTAVAAHDDMAATLAYGLEATQAYIVTEKDDDTDDEEDEDERGPHRNDDPTLAYDLQATQAYGVGAVDDTDDEDNNERESNIETVEGQSSKSGAAVNRIDAIQATIPYGLEATQAYGADETDDEDSNDQDKGSRGGDNDERESHIETVEGQPSKTRTMVNRIDTIQATIPYGLEATQAYGAEESDEEDSKDQGRGSGGGDQARGGEPTPAHGLAATLPYGGGDDDDEDNDEDSNKQVEEHIVRQENQATVAYGMEETQAYDDDNNDTDSAPYSAIESTQAYGIEEPSKAESQAQPNKQTAKKTTNNKRRVAFASSSAESAEVAEIGETEVDASVIETDKKSKPSTSTAVDTGEELQDSEDLIQPRSARSRRGRKKPVIQESQEEESQQALERKSPTEGKSKATNKLRKGRSKAASVTSSTADTTEELEGACGALEDEKPIHTPASRKGRRGAMRVTIEPEEPDEEEAPQETSTRRRGRKSKQAGDQEEGNKKETPTTAGRKRGRQTAKTTSAAEGSGEVSVEVEETPAPKSRRGRRGKLEQTEAVSVSETPLKTAKRGKSTGNEAIDTAAATTDVADSETTTAVDVEPTVRRGGRGRGRKGTTPKQMVQGVEAQVDQEESIESQPVTLVEATPSRGKGKSRGRGKRTQSLTNEPGTTESLDPDVSAISNEAQVAVASPAKGKVRGKGRGKKAQPLSTESEVPETSVVNEEELQPPESPAVAVASKGRGRGRQGRGKKTQVPSNTELESSEDISQTLSAPESSAEGSQIRRGRGRGKVPVSRESSEQGPSSDMDVEGTPAKKSRRGKDLSVSHSPSLWQGKPAGESNPRVIFTGLVDKQSEKVVKSLGGELVDNIHSCTHLVTDKVRRTVKFLCGLANGQLIVLPSWLDACKRAKSFVDSTPFLVKDKDAEKQFKFDLQRSHEVALRHGLLEGYKVHVTKKVKPEASQMKDIIQSAKGTFLSSMPRGKEDKVFVISCDEDRSICKKPLEAGIPVVSAEVLLTGILRQQLDLEEHKLFADEMSDTSQDTTSSSGQNKRRRQPSEAGTSSSPTVTKTSGSKRRKR